MDKLRLIGHLALIILSVIIYYGIVVVTWAAF